MDPVLHCLVIPIFDRREEIVGIIRREVPGFELPTKTKYLYSPGFSCADHLFGIHKHTGGTNSIVVEGSLDAIWLHQLGFTNAVSILGAYCSPVQQRLLAKMGYTVYVGLDMDGAGLEARERMIKEMGGKFILKEIIWPEKDPQACTPEQVKEAIENSYGFITKNWKYPLG